MEPRVRKSRKRTLNVRVVTPVEFDTEEKNNIGSPYKNIVRAKTDVRKYTGRKSETNYTVYLYIHTRLDFNEYIILYIYVIIRFI